MNNPHTTLRVLRIVEGTSVDGPGLRTSVYLAGCSHHCPGCHNPQSWNPMGGTEMSVEEIMRVIEANEAPVTLSGGDPLEHKGVEELMRRIHEAGLNLWVYTGYTYEQVLESQALRSLLPYIDVLVDGPFVEAERDLTLHFRGSRNQRIIHLHDEK